MVGQHARMKAGLFGSILRPPRVRREEERRHARRRARSSRYVGLEDEPARPAVDQPLLRRPAPAGDRPRAGVRAQAAAARRADGGDEPPGVGAADRLHAPAARRARAHDPADRARHAGGDGASPSTSPCWTTGRRSPRARPQEVRQNPRVIEAYLGKQAERDHTAATERRATRRSPTDGAARSQGHPHVLRQHRGAQGRLDRGRGGRVRNADRLQRSRQVHDAALDLGPHPAAPGLDPLRGPRDLRDASAGDRRAWASRSRRRAGTSSRA